MDKDKLRKLKIKDKTAKGLLISGVIDSALAEMDYKDSMLSPTEIFPFGFAPIDKIIKGFARGHLIHVLGGRCSGKTTFVQKTALNLSSAGKKVLLITPGQRKEKVVQNLLCIMADIPEFFFSLREAEPRRMAKILRGASELSKRPIYIDDKEAVTINCLERKIFDLTRSEGIDVVIIDSLQEIDPPGKCDLLMRYVYLGAVNKELVVLARKLDISIILVSRVVPYWEREGRFYQDMKNWRPIECYSDLILFFEKDKQSFILDEHGEVTVHVHKNRLGPVQKGIKINLM